MPAGHVERETINQRRPLSKNMHWCLARLAVRAFAPDGQGEKNSLYGLAGRGYASLPGAGSKVYIITEAGRKALREF